MLTPLQTVAASELKDCHDFARHTFAIFVSWYTFFVTANSIAGGWFISRLVESKPVTPYLFYSVLFLFIISNGIAIRFTHIFMKSIRGLHSRAEVIIRDLCGESGTFLPRSVMPIEIYTTATMGFRVSMYLMIATWIVGGITGWVNSPHIG